MSLHDIIKKNEYTVAIWKDSESLDELIKLTPQASCEHINSIKRKKEYLSIRFLLQAILPNSQISYNKHGGPELKNKNISISHSKGLSAIIISDKKVGVDIEKISNQTLRLSTKFILSGRHEPLTKEKTTLIWCCKEAIYKLYVNRKINFKDILIEEFCAKNEGEIKAKFNKNTHTLTYKRINNHFLVYVCK